MQISKKGCDQRAQQQHEAEDQGVTRHKRNPANFAAKAEQEHRYRKQS